MFPPESSSEDGPVAGHATCEQRRDADCPRALDDELRPLEEQHDRLRDLLVAHLDHRLERALENRPCQLSRVLDRDPVGDRLLARRADADQTRARPCRLQRDGDARGEPTAADGHEHGARLGNLLGQLEADRALAGDHELVLERVDERRAASSRHAAAPPPRPPRSSRPPSRPPRRSSASRRPSPSARPPGRRSWPRSRPRAPPTPPPGRGCRRWPPTTPAARSRSPSEEILVNAPRILNEPVRWRFSALSTTSRPARRENVSERKTGVTRATPSSRARAASMSAGRSTGRRCGRPSRGSRARPTADRAPGAAPRRARAAARRRRSPPAPGAPSPVPTRRRRPPVPGSVAAAPRAGRPARGRRGARSISSHSCSTFSPRAASVRTIGGRQARSGSRARIERTSVSIVFAAGWSILFTAITSGISMIPAFSAWIESPEPGHEHEQHRVRDPDHLDLALAGADRLDEDDVLAGRVEEQHSLQRRLGQAAEVAAGAHRANEDSGVEEVFGEPDAVAEQGPLRERAGRVDGDDADRQALRADVGQQSGDQARLADAGRAGDADRIGAPGTRIQLTDELGGERVGVLDERDRPRHSPRIAAAHAFDEALPRPVPAAGQLR